MGVPRSHHCLKEFSHENSRLKNIIVLAKKYRLTARKRPELSSYLCLAIFEIRGIFHFDVSF
jgi:hypothetical protein